MTDNKFFYHFFLHLLLLLCRRYELSFHSEHIPWFSFPFIVSALRENLLFSTDFNIKWKREKRKRAKNSECDRASTHIMSDLRRAIAREICYCCLLLNLPVDASQNRVYIATSIEGGSESIIKWKRHEKTAFNLYMSISTHTRIFFGFFFLGIWTEYGIRCPNGNCGWWTHFVLNSMSKCSPS